MLFKSIETEISFNLLIWGLCSMVGGITFILFENSFMNAIGFQFIIWGLIDSLIAIGPGIYRWIRNHEHIENLKKLKKIFIKNNVKHWIKILEKSNIPVGPLNNVREAVNSVQIKSRNMIVNLKDKNLKNFYVAGNPIKLSAHKDPKYRNKSPKLSEHKDKIIQEFKIFNKKKKIS